MHYQIQFEPQFHSLNLSLDRKIPIDKLPKVKNLFEKSLIFLVKTKAYTNMRFPYKNYLLLFNFRMNQLLILFLS